ncbi:MAG TPA: riboflavin synthase [Thermomicrobiales bacterium]|jgi:riboflavin synthase|nr:riboflavin synthase [Thermomicrobiales bacterium]
MFGGIVEEIGVVERINQGAGASLVIRCEAVLNGTRIGDSIATDGVCLTVTAFGNQSFRADVQPVTLRRSTLGALRVGDRVNLERSLAVGDRIGGHYVQGHVDGVGTIRSATGEGSSVVTRIDAPADIQRYVVERGYVAVDGASLTVAAIHPDGFEVSLVYHTQQTITLPGKRPGHRVNIEVDVMGKYVERLTQRSTEQGLTTDVLRRAGFI